MATHISSIEIKNVLASKDFLMMQNKPKKSRFPITQICEKKGGDYIICYGFSVRIALTHTVR